MIDIAAGLIIDRLSVLDTCVVSDALDHLGVSGAVTGLRPVWGRPHIAGRARTVEVTDAAAAGPVTGRHLATTTIESAGPGDVIVIANGGRPGVSCWGDILTVAAQERGITGTVIDGANRDADAIAESGYPVWSRSCVPVTARGRIAERATDVPVTFGGMLVTPGDYVIADLSGVVFVPAAHAAAVLDAAERLADKQQRMVEAVRGGRPVTAVMHDAQFTGALAAPANGKERP